MRENFHLAAMTYIAGASSALKFPMHAKSSEYHDLDRINSSCIDDTSARNGSYNAEQ